MAVGVLPRLVLDCARVRLMGSGGAHRVAHGMGCEGVLSKGGGEQRHEKVGKRTHRRTEVYGLGPSDMSRGPCTVLGCSRPSDAVVLHTSFVAPGGPDSQVPFCVPRTLASTRSPFCHLDRTPPCSSEEGCGLRLVSVSMREALLSPIHTMSFFPPVAPVLCRCVVATVEQL